MTTATVNYAWRVYCADGVRRHGGDFATKAEALQWETWRHPKPCPAGEPHRTVRIPTGDVTIDLTGPDRIVIATTPDR